MEGMDIKNEEETKFDKEKDVMKDTKK